MIRVGPPFLYSSMRKNRNVSADFWHRKMTSKIRNVLCSTFETKKNQRPRIFLYTPSWSWGQLYSSLNSAKLKCILEVALSLAKLTVSSSCGDEFNVFGCACVRTENRSQLILWITSSQEQLKWDLAMLKCQVTSFSYGIPGESKCFQCTEELKHFNSIAERFNHQFNYHGEQILFNVFFPLESLNILTIHVFLFKWASW